MPESSENFFDIIASGAESLRTYGRFEDKDNGVTYLLDPPLSSPHSLHAFI
jgi:hypothetical protein